MSKSVWRTESQARIIMGCGVAVAVVWVPGLISMASSDDWALSKWWLVVPIVVVGLVLLWVVRAARSSVIVDCESVVVRNPMSTVNLALDAADAVELRAVGIYPGIAVVRCKDGREVRAWGIQGRHADVAGRDLATERLVEALNAQLRLARNESHRRATGPGAVELA
ncbi:hypothetical protein LRS13_00610 [Svornostia abyssi]|uniref:Uncharacterized protein n=1 Tax=Svornostia abyssi TaxID=2898438 RepID=A0ABY5PHA7_9ACTN|nr:hypothetical protein LRS13_00610 [Parviterribacteraceae bacterium J379]